MIQRNTKKGNPRFAGEKSFELIEKLRTVGTVFRRMVTYGRGEGMWPDRHVNHMWGVYF
jgi:hypothetical protein